jgi:hypothetical protein
MARGRGRWENRDLRHTFPLPSERRSEPRFDGLYRDDEAGELRFASDGTLRWMHVHGTALHLRAERECDGAIGGAAISLLCADGKGREARTQFALTFKADA